MEAEAPGVKVCGCTYTVIASRAHSSTQANQSTRQILWFLTQGSNPWFVQDDRHLAFTTALLNFSIVLLTNEGGGARA